MKTKLTSILLLAALLCGCVTGPNTQTSVTPARMATVAEFAAFEGTSLWLAKHPEDRPKFEAARATLSLLARGTNATPADVKAVFDLLPIKELQGSEGSVIVGGAVILYDGFVREHINLESNEWLMPVIVGLNRGLTSAL